MATPLRQGIIKYLTLEHEAVEILESLAPGTKAQGKLVSALLRQEEARRIEARRLPAKLMAALVEEGVSA